MKKYFLPFLLFTCTGRRFSEAFLRPDPDDLRIVVCEDTDNGSVAK